MPPFRGAARPAYRDGFRPARYDDGMSWIIDTSFPGANACGAALDHHDGAPCLSMAADPRHGPEALWFRLRLRRLDADAPAPWLRLRNVDTLLGGGDGSLLRPVARCEDGAWRRLQAGTPLRLDDGRVDALWRLPAAAARLEIAFCLPYGADELDRLLAEAPALRLRSIGASEGGSPLLRLGNGDGVPGSGRPGIYVVARQHAGETPGSWILDGLLRRCAELGDAAPLVWAVPFVDCDGVASGAYGKDRHPVDYNRSWWTMGRRHEVHAIMADIGRWRKRCAPRLCLDLHAPGALESDGVYAYATIGGGEAGQPVLELCERMRNRLGADLASPDFVRHATYPSRWPRETHQSFTAWASGSQGLPALSLETSYQGMGAAAWDETSYREAGGRIADALA